MVAETSQTLDRGLTVLELLSDASDGLTVTEIAAKLGVSRTVVYRLVVTLEQHALLRRGGDGRCRLGMAVLALARQVQPVLREAAIPALRRLADSVGARHPLDRGAAGKAVLAARASGGRPFDPGWVISTGELQPGAYGVAAPLLGVAGIEASVGVVALTELPVDDVGPKVLRAAGEVARALR